MSELKKTDISDMDILEESLRVQLLKHTASGDVVFFVFFVFPGGRLMLYTQLVRKETVNV